MLAIRAQLLLRPSAPRRGEDEKREEGGAQLYTPKSRVQGGWDLGNRAEPAEFVAVEICYKDSGEPVSVGLRSLLRWKSVGEEGDPDDLGPRVIGDRWRSASVAFHSKMPRTGFFERELNALWRYRT